MRKIIRDYEALLLGLLLASLLGIIFILGIYAGTAKTESAYEAMTKPHLIITYGNALMKGE